MKPTNRIFDEVQPLRRRRMHGEYSISVLGTGRLMPTAEKSMHLHSYGDDTHSIPTTPAETFQSCSIDPTAMSCLPSSSYTACPISPSLAAAAGPSASRSAPKTYSHNIQRRRQISCSGSQSGTISKRHDESPTIKQEDDSQDDAAFERMFDYGKYDKDKDMEVQLSEGSHSLRYVRARRVAPSSATPVYPCDNGECGRAFLRQSELKKHRRVHFERNERPHPCSHCNMAFLWPKDLERHRRSKHTDQTGRFSCHVKGCQYSTQGFHRQDKLLSHLKTKHPTPCSGEVVSMEGQRLEQSMEDRFRYDQTSQVATESSSKPSSLDHSTAVTGCESFDASYLVVPSTQFGFEFAPELWKACKTAAVRDGVAPWATHTQDSKCNALYPSDDLHDSWWDDGQWSLVGCRY